VKHEDEQLIFRARKAGADADRLGKLYRETGELLRDETERMKRDHAELMKRVIPTLIALAVLIAILPWIDRVTNSWIEAYVAREKAAIRGVNR